MDTKLTLEQLADEVIDTDFLVVGGGCAGTMAAIRAKEKKGIDVVIIEKSTIRRGGMAGGGSDDFRIIHHKINGMDPEDDAGRIKRGRGIVDPKLELIGLKHAIKPLALLERIGVNMTDDDGTLKLIPLRPFPGVEKDAVYYKGADLKFKLEAEVRKRGVRILERTMLTGLIKHDDSVVGATAFNYRTGKFIVIKAKATIIATGGPYRIYQHRYATFPSNLWVERINPMLCCGGHAAAFRVGAKLVNMEFETVAVFPAGLANVGATLSQVMTNYEGENLYQKHFLDTPRSKGQPGIGWASYPFQPKGNPEIDSNVIYFRYESIPPEGEMLWASTTAQESPAGLKLLRDRGGAKGPPIEQSYWIHGPSRGVAGIRLDENGETSLKGLFAAGDVSNGGSGVSRSMTIGYRIGDYVREYTPDMKKPAFSEEQIKQVKQERERVLAPLGRKDGVNPLELNDFISKRADELIGIKKIEPKLKRAIETFEVLQEKFVPFLAASDSHELMRALEVQDILEIASVHAQASLARTETRMYPQHYRVDYPEQDDENWWGKVVVQNKQDGKLAYTLEKLDV
jgi:succinate dehydrogenase/fumarate reductase flavoprotein subunit